jgi:hypothetical protein
MAEAEMNLTERVLARLEEPLHTVLQHAATYAKTEQEWDSLRMAIIDYGTACVSIASEETFAEANAALEI